MDTQRKHFKYYEKIAKASLHDQINQTLEFRRFSEAYPLIAESIALNRHLKRLTKQLKTAENNGTKFRIKREIQLTKTKLRKNSLSKRLHGTNKQEKFFHKQLKRKTTKNRFSWIKKKIPKKGQSKGSFRLKLRRYLHRKLPPTLLNIREHDVSEKNLLLKEWLQEKRNELDNVLH